jgi:hypothetical protein
MTRNRAVLRHLDLEPIIDQARAQRAAYMADALRSAFATLTGRATGLIARGRHREARTAPA